MRKFVIFLSLIVCFTIQSTLFLQLNNSMIVPNLMIIFTATMGIMHGKKTGLIVGFCCGILSDIMFGPLLGLNAFLFMWIGFGNGYLNRIFNPEALKLPAAMITVSDIVYSLIFYVITFLLRTRFDFPSYLVKIIIPEILLTILVSVVMYPIILAVYNAFERKENGNN